MLTQICVHDACHDVPTLHALADDVRNGWRVTALGQLWDGGGRSCSEGEKLRTLMRFGCSSVTC
jgi:hypothetical protein